MKNAYFNDQAHIAESFMMNEEFITQSSRLSAFKINSFKLSLIKASFCKSRKELEDNLRSTLFNYQDNGGLLAATGFFQDELDN